MVAVKYEDLSAAFDFVSFAAPMEHHAYVFMDTGTIYWISELNPLDEDVPEDLETSDRYVAIPHKNDLDLGSELALQSSKDLKSIFAYLKTVPPIANHVPEPISPPPSGRGQ